MFHPALYERINENEERLGGDADEVSVTVALVGESRSGKLETAERMEGILNLALV